MAQLPSQTLSIGLALSQPSQFDPGMEVAAPGYTRKPIEFEQPTDAEDVLANVATTEWPRATSLWGDIGWLTAWTEAGQYYGWGDIVSVVDEITPVIVRIDRGDVARFRASGILVGLLGLYVPRGFGAGRFNTWRYGHGVGADIPPRPYSDGPYSFGPYSQGGRLAAVVGEISAAFYPAGSACPGASAWTREPLP